MQTRSEIDRTIVVGGGLAGLATAIYLARGGRQVTVLERAGEAGGRAITDIVQGFALNRGAHALYTGGAASTVLRELGVTYTAGIPKQVFALDARGLFPFPTDLPSIIRTSLLTALEKVEFARAFMALATSNVARFGSTSTADLLSATARSPRVRKLLMSTARVALYSDALDLVSADAFITQMRLALKHPIHYVAGGWGSLVTGLQQAAQHAGVEIRTSASVRHLAVADGRVQSVHLHDGSQMRVRDVVLAMPLPDAQQLLRASSVGELLSDAVPESIPAQVACLDLALSRLPDPQHPVVFHQDQPLFATAQSVVTRLAPAGGAVIHAMKQLDPRRPGTAHQDRLDLEMFMDNIQPGWRELVVEQRFLPHLTAVSALPLAARGGLAARTPHHLSSVPNLYFAGDWVGPHGWLIDASLGSARGVSESLLERRPLEIGSAVAREAVSAA